MPQIKGATLYTFNNLEEAQTTLSAITSELLSEKEFTPLTKESILAGSTGYTPFEDGEFVLQVSHDTIAVQVTQQVKKPKSSEVKRRCAKQEKAYMKDNNLEALSKDIKADIKNLIITEMLPDTFPDTEVTTVLWITKDKLTVGVGSQKKAEDLIDFLRLTLGGLPVATVLTDKTPTDVMTDMVDKEYNEALVLCEKVEMISEEGGKIAFCKESVYNVSYQQHIKDGATVVKLALEHNGGVEFTINDKLEFTGVKINKDFLAGSKGEGSLVITIDEINKMSEEVIKVMGGRLNSFS